MERREALQKEERNAKALRRWKKEVDGHSGMGLVVAAVGDATCAPPPDTARRCLPSCLPTKARDGTDDMHLLELLTAVDGSSSKASSAHRRLPRGRMRVVTTPTQASGRFVTATHTLVMADEGACFLWDAADGHAVVPTDAVSDRLWGRCRADAEWRQSVLVSDRGDGVPPRVTRLALPTCAPRFVPLALVAWAMASPSAEQDDDGDEEDDEDASEIVVDDDLSAATDLLRALLSKPQGGQATPTDRAQRAHEVAQQRLVAALENAARASAPRDATALAATLACGQWPRASVGGLTMEPTSMPPQLSPSSAPHERAAVRMRVPQAANKRGGARTYVVALPGVDLSEHPECFSMASADAGTWSAAMAAAAADAEVLLTMGVDAPARAAAAAALLQWVVVEGQAAP